MPKRKAVKTVSRMAAGQGKKTRLGRANRRQAAREIKLIRKGARKLTGKTPSRKATRKIYDAAKIGGGAAAFAGGFAGGRSIRKKMTKRKNSLRGRIRRAGRSVRRNVKRQRDRLGRFA